MTDLFDIVKHKDKILSGGDDWFKPEEYGRPQRESQAPTTPITQTNVRDNDNEDISSASAIRAKVISDAMGEPPEAITQEVQNAFASETKKVSNISAFDSAKATLDIANANIQLADLYYEVMSGRRNVNDPQIKELEQFTKARQADVLPSDETNVLQKTIQSVAQMYPFMRETVTSSIKGGGYAALGAMGTAALLGQLGPQVTLPEEIITVPAAGLTAFSAASAGFAYKRTHELESALAFRDMLQEGVSQDVALPIAHTIGALNGLIEVSQLDMIVKATPLKAIVSKAIREGVQDSIKSGVLKTLAKRWFKEYPKFVIGETAQELTQEVVSIVGENIAKHMTGVEPDAASEIVARLKDTAVSAALGMSAIGMAAHGSSSIHDVASIRKKSPKLADLMGDSKATLPHMRAEEAINNLDRIMADPFDPEVQLPRTAHAAKLGMLGNRDVRYFKLENEMVAHKNEIAKLLDPTQNVDQKRLESAMQLFLDLRGKAQDLPAAVKFSEELEKVETATGGSLATPEDVASAINARIPGIGLKFDAIQEGFGTIPPTYQYTMQEGPAKGATFNAREMTPESVEEALTKMIQMRDKEWQAPPKVDMSKIKDKRAALLELIERRSKKKPKGVKEYTREQFYKDLRDEGMDAEEKIKLYEDYTKMSKKERHWFHVWQKLSPEQKAVYKLSQNLTEAQAKYVDEKFHREYNQLAIEQLDDEMLYNIENSYAARMWKLEKVTPEQWKTTFAKSTRHSLAREIPTILHGWASGLELRVSEISNAYTLYKQAVIKASEARRLLSALEEMKDDDGNPILSRSDKGLPGYRKIEIENFSTWTVIGKAGIDLKALTKDYFVGKDGTVFKSTAYYAPDAVATDLENLFGRSKLFDIPGVKKLTEINRGLKRMLFKWGLFHFSAYGRSYYLGSKSNMLKEPAILTAHRDGIKMMREEEPILMLGIKNGLTLDLAKDWAEEYERFGLELESRIREYTKDTAIIGKMVELSDRISNHLFYQVGPGLKAKAYILELKELIKKNPDADINGLAADAAELVNNDFGGLHLERIGRNPSLQHLFRLVALAPDWTESNIRTWVGMFKRTENSSTDTRQIYRSFWLRVGVKAWITSTILNGMISGLSVGLGQEDVDKAWKRFKYAYHDPLKFRWMSIDITPFYHMFGGNPKVRQYISVLGHFEDPIKAMYNPAQFMSHKKSRVASIGWEFLTQENWRGQRFTTVQELLNGQGLVTWNSKYDQFLGSYLPSFMLHELIGSSPIGTQAVIAHASGEQTMFDSFMEIGGIHTKSVDLSSELGKERREVEYKRKLKLNLPKKPKG